MSRIREFIKSHNIKPQTLLLLVLLFVAAFLAGRGIGRIVVSVTQTDVIVKYSSDWGLGFGTPGAQPKGNAGTKEMSRYNAYYMGNANDKVIYLTFDCGYENGNTPAILDALKKHNAPATFFVVGHFVQSAPDIVKRMIEDGHTVGNHTYHHYDMSKLEDKSSFKKELDSVSELFEQTTGQKMSMYYRPPQGKYSTDNLQMAKDLGYCTFFWSLAYVDWNVDKQPTNEEAIKKLTDRIHPGAVVLLHNTSSTNGKIMDEILTKWEGMGYTFKPLSELMSQYQSNQTETPTAELTVGAGEE